MSNLLSSVPTPVYLAALVVGVVALIWALVAVARSRRLHSSGLMRVLLIPVVIAFSGPILIGYWVWRICRDCDHEWALELEEESPLRRAAAALYRITVIPMVVWRLTSPSKPSKAVPATGLETGTD